MNDDYEAIHLGQLLSNNDILFDDKYRLQPDHFTDTKNREIFKTVLKVLADGDTAAIDSVYAKSKIDPAYISGLTTLSTTSANWEFYQRKILERFERNNLNILQLTITDMLKDHEPVHKIQETAEKLLSEIDTHTNQSKIENLADAVPEYYKQLDDRRNAGGRLLGISTGFSRLDYLTGGLQAHKNYCIGGRPSNGKSALLKTIAVNTISRGIKAGFISLESSIRELLERVIAQLAGVDTNNLSFGNINNQDTVNRLMDAQKVLNDSTFIIYDKPNTTLQDVRRQARRMKSVHNIEILFVDYVQLIKTPGSKDRTAEVAIASLGIKDLARELEIPIVTAAQLRRDADSKRPTLGDFQHSSNLEQDADVAILLHKTNTVDEVGNPEVMMLVEKNRDGKTGVIRTSFNKSIVTFEEVN